MDRLGLDPETVPRRWPRLVNCSISGYGTTGPDKDRKALDLLIQGESGLPSVTGTRAEPCKIGVSVAVMCAAMYARSGILAGLRARERTDLGDYIDISMLESMVDWMGAPLYLQMYRNSAPTRNGARQHDRALRALRDWGRAVVNIAVQTRAQWESLCRVVLDVQRSRRTSASAPTTDGSRTASSLT
jgi:itaconate CoA-transferase